MNSLSLHVAARPVLDFALLMADLRNPDKLPQMLWVHLMVLSTLMPTLIHFVFVLSALVLSVKIRWRAQWIENFWGNCANRRHCLHYHLLSSLLTALLAGALLYGLALAIMEYAKPVAMLLWHWADTLLQILDSGYQTPLKNQN